MATAAHPPSEPKWFNSPVTFHTGTLAGIRSFIPEFERRPFALTQPGNDSTCLNDRLDMIVRKPCGEDRSFIPVGVVSREYSLVQHTDVIDVAAKALKEAKIAQEQVKVDLKITEYGERMALSLFLPDYVDETIGIGCCHRSWRGRPCSERFCWL